MGNKLELIIGPVCSGKSSELIRRIDRYSIAGYNVLVLKPSVDTRSEYVESRTGVKLNCHEINLAEHVYDKIVDVSLDKDINIDIIAFDEAQFFPDLYDVAYDLIRKDYKLLVSALDSDFRGMPFGDINRVVNISDSITRLTGVCMECRNDNAIFSQKLKKGGNQIEVGNLELYQPRCASCFVPGGLRLSESEKVN